MSELQYLHNKEEFPPAHTAQHLLNQLMFRMFGCKRAVESHIERKKSKMTYVLSQKPDRHAEREIERAINQLITDDLAVTYHDISIADLPEGIDISRLPQPLPDQIRVVNIGDYDCCLYVGKHVRSTGQIGKFVLLGTNWDEHTKRFRIRYKVV